MTKTAADYYSRAVSYQSPSLRALVVGVEKSTDKRSMPSGEILESILDEMVERGIIKPQPNMIEAAVNEKYE